MVLIGANARTVHGPAPAETAVTAPLWPQRIYRVEHDGMGTFDLFIVPVGRKNGGMEYEAIFT
jgi:hypothetical protein